MRLVLRRANDSVCSRLQVTRRPEVQCIAHVADDTVVNRRHVTPFSRGGLDLQTGDILAPEQSQRSEVGMGARPSVLYAQIVGQRARMVGHISQMVLAGVGVLVSAGEVIFRQLEDNGEQGEDLACKVKGFL